MATDATRWIAEKIWKEEWDPQSFTKKNLEKYLNLKLKLNSLPKQDV